MGVFKTISLVGISALSLTLVACQKTESEPKVTEEDVKNMTEEQKTEMLLKLLEKK